VTIKPVWLPVLYIVVEMMTLLLYGRLGYGALVRRQHAKLKKNYTPCRYCVGQGKKLYQLYKDLKDMSKRELIDYICEINKSAKPEFLANFSEEELNAYLEHLMELDLKELVVCD
jgi:hypothetical protein